MENKQVQYSSSSSRQHQQQPLKFKTTRWADAVLHLVCTFLTTSEHIALFARSCKHWQHVAAQPASWNQTIFHFPWPVPGGGVAAAMKRWNFQRVTEFNTDFSTLLAQDIAVFKSMAPTLRVLDIRDAINLRGSASSALASCLAYALETLEHLVKLDLHPLDFDYDPHDDVSACPAANWLKCVPKTVTSLSLTAADGWLRAGCLSESCPNLTELNLAYSRFVTVVSVPPPLLAGPLQIIRRIKPEDFKLSEMANMPNLTKLNADNSYLFPDERVHTLPDISPLCHITDLDLSNNGLVYVQNPVGNGPLHYKNDWPLLLPVGLRRLVADNNKIRSLAFMAHLPNLEEVSVQRNTLYSGRFINTENFWRILSKLRTLNITRCGVEFWEVVAQRVMCQGAQPPIPACNIISLHANELHRLAEGDASLFDEEEIKDAVDRQLAGEETEDSDESELDDGDEEDEPEAESGSDSDEPEMKSDDSSQQSIVRKSRKRKHERKASKKHRPTAEARPRRKRRKVQRLSRQRMRT